MPKSKKIVFEFIKRAVIKKKVRYNFIMNSNYFFSEKGEKMLEKIKKAIFKVAIYIRLSKEDMDREGDDSESVKNQRILLEEYVKKLGEEYELVDIYIDQRIYWNEF